MKRFVVAAMMGLSPVGCTLILDVGGAGDTGNSASGTGVGGAVSGSGSGSSSSGTGGAVSGSSGGASSSGAGGAVSGSSGGSSSSGAPGSALWVRRIGPSDQQRTFAVALDGLGGLGVAGVFGGGIDLGEPPVDGGYGVFVAKLATDDGATQWASTFGSGNAPVVRGLASGPSGFVIAGRTVGLDFGQGLLPYGAFAASFSPQGDVQWSRTLCNDTAYDVAVNGLGEAFVTGSCAGPAPIESCSNVMGAGGIFVAKLDSNGACVWRRHFGSGSGKGRAIKIDDLGAVLVAGDFGGSIDAGGSCQVGSLGGQDAFVMELDTNAGCAWVKAFGGAGDQMAWDIATQGQELIVVGDFNKAITFGGDVLDDPPMGTDIFMAKLDVMSMGAPIWSRPFFGNNLAANVDYERGLGVTFAGNGDVIMAGAFEGQIDFADGGSPLVSACNGGLTCPDLFVVRLDPDGNPIWSDWIKDSGGAQQQLAYKVTIDGTGVYVVGEVSGEVSFPPLMPDPPNQGGRDALILKLQP